MLEYTEREAAISFCGCMLCHMVKGETCRNRRRCMVGGEIYSSSSSSTTSSSSSSLFLASSTTADAMRSRSRWPSWVILRPPISEISSTPIFSRAWQTFRWTFDDDFAWCEGRFPRFLRPPWSFVRAPIPTSLRRYMCRAMAAEFQRR